MPGASGNLNRCYNFLRHIQAEIIYKNYCGGCHGAGLEGNSATKLIKTKWLYGSDRNAIFPNIKSGIPNPEMRGWGNVLKDNQLNSLVNFILASQNKPAKSKDTVPARIVTKDYVLKVEKLVTSNITLPGELSL